MVRKKMKQDLTTGTWQDDTGCPISIILVSTSDDTCKVLGCGFNLKCAVGATEGVTDNGVTA